MPYDGADGYAIVTAAIAAAFLPKRVLTNLEWGREHFILSGKSAQETGRWRPERIPFLPGILAALDDSHPAELVVFVGSSQVAKSTCGLIWIGRTITEAPVPFLALFPTEKDARKWVRVRLNPMIASTPALRRLMPPNRRTEDANTLAEKHYPDGVLYTGSANIPTDVASVSVAKVLFDERDRMPAEIPGEGDPVELAKRRTAAFARRKIFEASTPTTEEESGIWADWLASTQDRYYVPCPHCNATQVLTFDNLKWPSGKPERAEYMCDDCAAMIGEHAKREMLEAGQWRSTFPEREWSVKGFHVNGLYTPLGLGDTWGQHAAAWDRASGKPEKVQVFFNTRRGEPVKSAKLSVLWEELARRREPFRIRTIPQGVVLLTAGADVQHDRIEVGVFGWSRGERMTVIDYLALPGNPTRDEVWKKLDEFLAGSIENRHRIPLRISCAAIDSGAWQHEVVGFTRTRKSRNIIATKGSAIRSRAPIGKPTLVDVSYRGSSQKYGAEQYQIGVSVLKTTLYNRLIADGEALPAERSVRFSADLSDEFFHQLAAERFDPRKGWHKVEERNEALDITVLGMVAAMHHSTAVHRFRDQDWDRLEGLYESGPKPAARADEGGPKLDGGRFVPSVATVVRGTSE